MRTLIFLISYSDIEDAMSHMSLIMGIHFVINFLLKYEACTCSPFYSALLGPGSERTLDQ